MNNENKEFFINDVENNISEEEIVLASPTELYGRGKGNCAEYDYRRKISLCTSIRRQSKRIPAVAVADGGCHCGKR